MTKNKFISLLCPIAFLLFGAYIRLSTITMTKRDSTFPNMVAYTIIAISIIEIIVGVRSNNHKDIFKGVNFLKLAECTIAMILYVFLLDKIGFVIDTLFLTAYTMYVLGYKNYRMLALASITITATVFIVFKYLLKVPLPTLWL